MAKIKNPEPLYTNEQLVGAINAKGAFLAAFYDDIKDDWTYYVEWKKAHHKSQFAMPRTEAAAIENLYDKSDGDAKIAQKLIEYATIMGWEGIYVPKDPALWAKWKRDAEVPDIKPGAYLYDLRDDGWPHEALSKPQWCAVHSAEALTDPEGSYEWYLFETVAWFGPLRPGNYLQKHEWMQWIRQAGEFNFDINPNDFASLAIKRLEIQIKFAKSGEINFKSFFLRHKPV